MYMTEVANGVLIGEKVIPYNVIGGVGLLLGVLFVLFVVVKVIMIRDGLK